MREVVIHEWCDVHYHEQDGTRIPATLTVPIEFDGMRRDLAVCEDCRVKRLAPLGTLVGYGTVPEGFKPRRGRPRKTAEVATDELTCFCGYQAKNKQGLGSHQRSQHNIPGKFS